MVVLWNPAGVSITLRYILVWDQINDRHLEDGVQSHLYYYSFLGALDLGAITFT